MLPTRAEQARVTASLNLLNAKIRNNYQVNQTLESFARRLFKSWFIDFDPACAKSEGREAYGMDAETAEHFPTGFENSDLGNIPKGWEIMRLDAIANFRNGLAMQRYPVADNDSLPVIKIAQLRAGNTKGGDRASADIPKEYIVYDGDVLFSWSGSLLVDIWCGGKGGLNQHLFKVTSDRYPKWFYYLWLKEHLRDFQSIAADKATTMGHIQRHHLAEAKVFVPSSELMNAVGKIIAPLLEAIVANNLQSRTLAQLRDLLLRKLISAQPAADRQATAIVQVKASEIKSAPKKVVSTEAVEESKPRPHEEAVILSTLTRRLGKDFPLGRKRYNKVSYFVHRKMRHDVAKQFMKQPAGPYSPWSRYGGPEQIALKNGYVAKGKRDKVEGFIAGKKSEAAEKYLSAPTKQAVEWAVNSLRYKKNDQLELLATIDYAALELQAKGLPVSVNAVLDVINSTPAWLPKLKKAIFSEEHILNALVELKRYFPDTYMQVRL